MRYIPTKQTLDVYMERAEVTYPNICENGLPAIDTSARILKDRITNLLYTDTGYNMERIYQYRVGPSGVIYRCQATKSARV